MCDFVELYRSSLAHGYFSCDSVKPSPILDRRDAATSLYTWPYVLRYWLADHPSIAWFRWDQGKWGGSWTFLAASVPLYLFLVFFIHLLFSWRKKPIPLGPIPVLHNLFLLLSSILIFVGCWQAAMVEIEESQLLWGKSRRGLEWLLCFPLGTRPTGRVFFWSYAYYLTKYLELFNTLILVLRKKRITFRHLFHRAAVVIMCFCWLQFTQSLQIITIIINTGASLVKYLYLLLHSLGYSPSWKKVVTYSKVLQYVLSFVASVGYLRLHFCSGGCSGMGVWIFNSFFNITVLFLSQDFHKKQNPDCKEIAKGTNPKQS